MPTAADEAQTALRGVARLALDELTGVMNALAAASADQTRDVLLQVLPALADKWGAAAAALAADWYEAARSESGVTGGFAVVVPPATPMARLDELVRWGVAPLYDLTPDRAATDSRIGGELQKLIADAHRQTIVKTATSDQAAIGYVRHARANACAFCRVLATRGVVDGSNVYRTRHSAERVTGQSAGGWDYGKVRQLAAGGMDPQAAFEATLEGRKSRAHLSRPLGQKYHAHCYCTAVPVFRGQTYVAPKYVYDWADAYNEAHQSKDSLKDVLAKMRANDPSLNH